MVIINLVQAFSSIHHIQRAHPQVTWCWLWCLQEWSSGRWLCIGWSIATLGWCHCTLAAVVTALWNWDLGHEVKWLAKLIVNDWFGDFEMVFTQIESSWQFKSVPTRQFHYCTTQTKDQIVVASPAPSGRICAKPSCLLVQYIDIHRLHRRLNKSGQYDKYCNILKITLRPY